MISLDLKSGERSVAARSSFPHGTISDVGVAGDWTVFVEQSAIQNDAQHDVLWRIVAVQPARKQRLVLATNGEVPDPFVPWLGSSNGQVFWSTAEADRTAREWLWTPNRPLPRTLLRHVALRPGTETVNNRSMVFLGDPANPGTDGAVAGDCWQVSLTGGGPKAITHGGRAMGCASDGTWLVWQAHIDPSIKPSPREGILDDPYEIWAQRSGAKPIMLHRGYTAGTWPVVVDGSAIWADEGGAAILQDLGDPRLRKNLGKADPRRLALVLGDAIGIARLAGSEASGQVDLKEVVRG